MDEKLKSEKNAKYSIFQYFRMRHFVVKISKKFLRKGALTLPNQNPADVLARPS